MDEPSTLAARTVFRFVLSTLPIAWMRNAPTAAAIDQERGGTAPSEFQADVDELKVLIHRFTAAVKRGMDPHPFLGNLSRGEWGPVGGLDVSQGLLVIVDGGKGLRAAVRKAFRHRALVQRCQWHKRENVGELRGQA